LRFQAGHFGFQLINLATQACLPTIKGASIQKEWMPDLMAIQINDTGPDQHSHAPIEAEQRLDVLKGDRTLHRNLDNKIKHGVASPISLDDLP
jgi:hypothetical protein